jgi:hypothetical protein
MSYVKNSTVTMKGFDINMHNQMLMGTQVARAAPTTVNEVTKHCMQVAVSKGHVVV